MVAKNGKTAPKSSLQINYIKSRFFRVVHGDGVIGNITPKRDVFVSFYNERPSLPDMMMHEITDDGRLGDAVKEENTRPGLMREMEFGIVLDVETAKSFAVWLTVMASKIEASYATAEEPEQKDAD